MRRLVSTGLIKSLVRGDGRKFQDMKLMILLKEIKVKIWMNF